MSTKPRVAISIGSLSVGGAEFSAVALAQHWHSLGWEVFLIVGRSPADPTELSSHLYTVIIEPLVSSGKNFGARVFDQCKKLLHYRKLLRSLDVDVVVSFADWMNIYSLLAGCKLRCPLIISERVDPAFLPMDTLGYILRFFLYRGASAGVGVCETAAQSLMKLGVPKVEVIPGPFLFNDSSVALPSANEELRFVAIGRITFQKGFDILVEAFSLIADQIPQWKVSIFGEGPDKEILHKLILDRNLQDRIKLEGAKTPILPHLREGDILVIPSRFEGFPRVLGEALLLGMPVIGTKSPGDISRYIIDGENGLLVEVEDAHSLGTAMKKIALDGKLRKSMGSSSLSQQKVMELKNSAINWTNLILQILKRAE